MKSLKIVFPRRITGLLFLARDILAKHNELGADSPLDADFVSELQALYDRSKTLSDEKKKKEQDAHFTTDQRNRVIGVGDYRTNPKTLYQKLIEAKAILKVKFYKNERKLSQFGFEVDASTSNDSDSQDQNDQHNGQDLSPPQG